MTKPEARRVTGSPVHFNWVSAIWARSEREFAFQKSHGENIKSSGKAISKFRLMCSSAVDESLELHLWLNKE